MLNETVIQQYFAILREELIPATGCTEPIAIAYCAAKMAELLGERPTAVLAQVSGNILKNVKGVVVPNTGERKGLEAAIAAGIVAGKPERELQVIADVTAAERKEISRYLAETKISVEYMSSPCQLDIRITGSTAAHSATVRINNNHTNVVQMAKDGVTLLDRPIVASSEDNMADKSCLNVEDIIRFADAAPAEELEKTLARQIEDNMAIAEEGLRGDWGARIGKILLGDAQQDIRQIARAYAAAGSDARMSGCEMPVVILSGSGNQGITASVPVVCYAKHIGAARERLLRALAVSDLITVHQKSGIGRLSAYCGAISAGVGAGAGICYLLGGDYTAVAHTVVNAVAILSGTICDGAKPSCAAKIASAVDAGILGYQMWAHHNEFHRGEGIVADSVDRTIANVGMLASEGMRQTDETILQIMQNC